MARVVTTISAGSLATISTDGNRVLFSVFVTAQLFVLFYIELRVCSRHRNTKPDKRQKGIR